MRRNRNKKKGFFREVIWEGFFEVIFELFILIFRVLGKVIKHIFD